MTGPVLAFDVTASRGAKLTRVASDAASPQTRAAQVTPPVSTPDPTMPQVVATAPPAPQTTQFSASAQARAEVTATYAAILGQNLRAMDVLECPTEAEGQDLPAPVLVRALKDAGLSAQLIRAHPPKPQHWPALAEMTSGQLVLVLEQSADMVVLHNLAARDNRDEVPVDAFTENFTGRIIRADVPAAELSKRHADKGAKAHWFWGEIANFRRIIGEVALGSFVANLLAVAVALFSLQVYDRVIPNQSVETLWVLAIGAGLAMMLEAGLRIARARLMDNAGRRIELRLQDLLMNRLLGMQAGQPGQTPSGTFAAVREFSAIREFFTASTIGTLTDLPFIFLFLFLVASIGGPVVWVLVIGGIVMVLPSLFLQKRMMALTLETQGASTKASRLLHESIYDIDTIKAQRGEDRFRRVWSELSGLSSVSSSEQRRLSSTLTFWAQGVQQATYVSAVVVGTFLVFAGEFTVGTIIAVGILTSRTLGPLTGLAGTLARWSNTKAALIALDAIVNAPQDTDEDRTYLRRDRLNGAFDLREMSYQYDEESGSALDVPNMTIPAGQHVAVLGANGSGKSTLLKILSGLHRPTSGRVLIDGVDMGQIATRDLRRSVGYLGQEVRLFAGTLRDNMNMTQLERNDDRLLAALDFAGMGQFVRNHPKGLDLSIRDGGEGLSIGQRQSIGWSRLWLQDPAVCLLDEPTSALDQTLEATLVSRLSDWLDGRTAIIATHRVPLLELTSRTIVLHNGRLAVDGPRDEVLAHMQKQKAS